MAGLKLRACMAGLKYKNGVFGVPLVNGMASVWTYVHMCLSTAVTALCVGATVHMKMHIYFSFAFVRLVNAIGNDCPTPADSLGACLTTNDRINMRRRGRAWWTRMRLYTMCHGGFQSYVFLSLVD